MRRVLIPIGFVVAAALLVAACGGGDNATTAVPTATQAQSNASNSFAATTTSAARTTSAATSTPAGTGSAGAIDACSVLTKNEVTVAINEPVGDGAPSNSPPNYVCQWDSASGKVTIYVTLYTTGTAAGANSEYSLLDSMSEAVSGLGEKAHWVSTLKTLESVKGKYNVEVQVVDLRSGSDDKGEATALATKVLGRLP